MQSLACVVVKKLHDCGFRVVRIRVDGFCRVGGGVSGCCPWQYPDMKEKTESCWASKVGSSA